MASSRRTYDTDAIILRKISAFQANDAVIPALQTLTSDGKGGTFWAIPSTLGGLPAYNSIVVDNIPYVADLSYNTLFLSSAIGIGMTQNSTTKRIDLYAKCFSHFDISGNNTISAYSNATVQPRVKFAGTGGVRITSDPLTNTLYFGTMSGAVSTGNYSYGTLNLVSNVQERSSTAPDAPNHNYLSATSPSSILNVMGLGDIQLWSDSSNSGYYIGISSFTSQGYLDISGAAFGCFSSILSTTSSLFYDRPQIGTTTSSLLSFTSNVSTGINTAIVSDRSNVMNNYTNLGLFQSFSTGQATNIQNVSTTVESLVSSFHFYSSLGVTDVQTVIGGVIGGSQCSVSSVSFRLDSLSSMLVNADSIEVLYKPSFVFPQTSVTGVVQTVSTSILASKSVVSNSGYTRPWMSLNSSSSNIYTDTISLSLDPSSVLESLTSTYTLFHTVAPFSGYATSNLLNAMDSQNSVSVRIDAMKFTIP